MAKSSLAAIILAAGKGTRMRSELPKVLHPVGGAPLVAFPIDLARRMKAEPTVVVIGHGAGRVSQVVAERFGGAVKFQLQADQRGTGHAVMEGMKTLKRFSGQIMILSGDVPLLRIETLRKLTRRASKKGCVFSLVSMNLADPAGYGRVVRGADNAVQQIVEHKDATPEQRALTEVNAGIYCGDAAFIRGALKKLGTDNAQGEYYLTDLIAIAAREGKRVEAEVLDDPNEVLGANDRSQLAMLDRLMRERTLHELMVSGVTIVDPAVTYIEPGIKIGRDTTIYPQVHLRGNTKIGSGCTIDTGCVITDGEIGNDVVVRPYSIIEQAQVRRGAIIGPFARLRPDTKVMEGAHVGNFVELKKTTLGKGAKANHLAYLGDAEIGAGSNIGAGTITCNYDGYGKYKTKIGDRVFVGSNSTLVAPVTLRNDVYVAAGSTVTEDAAPDSLVFGRARQIEKKGRASELRDTAQKRAVEAKREQKG